MFLLLVISTWSHSAYKIISPIESSSVMQPLWTLIQNYLISVMQLAKCVPSILKRSESENIICTWKKIKNKNEKKALLQSVLASNYLEAACWSSLRSRAPVMTVCQRSCLVVRGHRSQLPEDSYNWMLLWKVVLLYRLLTNVSSLGSCSVHGNMTDKHAACLVKPQYV